MTMILERSIRTVISILYFVAEYSLDRGGLLTFSAIIARPILGGFLTKKSWLNSWILVRSLSYTQPCLAITMQGERSCWFDSRV